MRRALVAFGLALLWPAAGEAQSGPPGGAVEVRGALAVPVETGGVGPYYFLADSCLATPVVSPEAAAYLEAPMAGGEGEEEAPRALLSQTTFSGLPPAAMTAMVVDLGPLSKRKGARIDGLLPAYQPGYEVVLAWSPPRVWWRAPGSADLQPAAPHTVALRIESGGVPTVPVLLNESLLARLRIDTLYPGVLALPRSVLESAGGDAGQPALSLRDSQGHVARFAVVEQLEFAGVHISQVLCEVTDQGPARMGAGLLRRFELAMSYEAGLARFAPLEGRRLHMAAPEGYGMFVEAREEDGWSVQVAEDSPAAKAGVAPGMRLIAAAMEPLGGLRAGEVEALLAAPSGTAQRFTLLDGVGAEKTVVLVAQPLVQP